jgi:hypothetical protein
MTKLLQFTLNVPKIPPAVSMRFANRVRRSRVDRLSWSSRLSMLAAASKLRASNLSAVSHLSFANFAHHPAPTNKNVTDLCLQLQHSCISFSLHSYTQSIWTFFSPPQCPKLSPPKILTLPPEWSCICRLSFCYSYLLSILALHIILSLYCHAWWQSVNTL